MELYLRKNQLNIIIYTPGLFLKALIFHLDLHSEETLLILLTFNGIHMIEGPHF